MLTVSQVIGVEELELTLAAGERGLGHEVTGLHVSELEEPTEYLEGGELLLTTGGGFGELATRQRAFLRRLAEKDIAGLGVCLGYGLASIPSTLVAAANVLDVPLFSVPRHVPSIAISKFVFGQLANERLAAVSSALEVNENLTKAVVQGAGLPSLLEILARSLHCSIVLLDEGRRPIAEQHVGRPLPFDGGLELSVLAGDQAATLCVSRPSSEMTVSERLILHQGQNAIALQLSLRRAVGAAELRLAGDLLTDIEEGRLSERELTRKMTAFGLRPEQRHAPFLALPPDGLSGEQLRLSIARELDRRPARYLSTARTDRAEFIVEVRGESKLVELAEALVASRPGVRVGLGRAADTADLPNSIAEARASLTATDRPIASYRDLGSVELLLSLPQDTLRAFVDQVLEGAADDEGVMEALDALTRSSWRWNVAAEELGVHRHTLRYRMHRLKERTGRDPEDPDHRIAFWFALKAKRLLDARENGCSPSPAPPKSSGPLRVAG